MPKISNWTTEFTRNLNDPETQQELASEGEAVIARFTHEPTETVVEYVYHGRADDTPEPYEIRCVSDPGFFEEEGFYPTRTAGYEEGNRQLRRRNEEIPELRAETCGHELSGDGRCSREIDDGQEHCWQHRDEEDEDAEDSEENLGDGE